MKERRRPRLLLTSLIAAFGAARVSGFGSTRRYLDSLSPATPDKNLASDPPAANLAAPSTATPRTIPGQDGQGTDASGGGGGQGVIQLYVDGVPSTWTNVDITYEAPQCNSVVPQEATSSIFVIDGYNNGGATTATATAEDAEADTPNLMQQVRDAGTAGIVSYALWELGFWALSIPACFVGYQAATGHWPDLADPEDQKKLGAEAFAFVNVARFAVPLRIGLALGTAPWIDENVIRRFGKNDEDGDEGNV